MHDATPPTFDVDDTHFFRTAAKSGVDGLNSIVLTNVLLANLGADDFRFH